MSSIPIYALQFGGLSMTESPVSYDKTRIAGSTNVSYILHCKGGCMPGQKELFTTNSRSKVGIGAYLYSNKVIKAFKRERYIEGHPVMGIKFPKGHNDYYSYDQYVANDDDTLNLAIRASYRQVFGNFQPMESERPIEIERRLRNGDIPIREFIRLIAKSPFYRTHYFENVNQQRCIELNLKHILGRPPLSQEEIIFHIELLYSEGFDAHIDTLIDSMEYHENFGVSTVPYQRCWNSPCGVKTSTFNLSASLARSFATSDNAIHGRKTTWDEPSGVSQLVQELTSKISNEIQIPQYAEYLSETVNLHVQKLDNEPLPN